MGELFPHHQQVIQIYKKVLLAGVGYICSTHMSGGSYGRSDERRIFFLFFLFLLKKVPSLAVCKISAEKIFQFFAFVGAV